VAPILPRNTKLPAKRSYELATVRDGQAELELVVFQGDSPRAAECEYLGTVRVEGLPPGPRGAVKVAVEFALGPEGILAVTARELSTGRITEATLATTDTQADLQRKLQIPEPSEAQSPTGSAAPPPGGAGSKKGLLDRLFGKR
jgi:molecular chaperone DnaK